MKEIFYPVLLSLVGGSCALAATPQSVTVVVLNAHVQPPAPVQGVRVSLSYLDGVTQITDSRDVTNRQGEAWLQVSPDAQERGDLRIEVSGASGLVMYQPAEGIVSALPGKITIQLLPKSSPALQGPAQIEAMLYRYSRQVERLKTAIAQNQTQKPDFSSALKEWANAKGFSYEEVDKQVREWADGIEEKKDQATLREKTLAELAKRNYAAVVQLADKGLIASAKELDEGEQVYLEGRRKSLREYVGWAETQAKGYELKFQFHEATQALEKARDKAATEHKRFPEDNALQEIWLNVSLETTNGRMYDGASNLPSRSLSLLTLSVQEYQVLLDSLSGPGDRGTRAKTQSYLGYALMYLGERSGGEKAVALLEQAVQADERALEVYTKADLPQDWAAVQCSVGNALSDLGERSSGEKAVALLEQAVQADERALEVYTKADLPQNWAMTQVSLGDALSDLGERSSGEKGVGLLEEAVRSDERALEIYTKTDLPLCWASTQNNLSIALMYLGRRSGGEKGAGLLEQAVAADEKALEVYTKPDLPQDWARTQTNLGNALSVLGDRSSGEKAAVLLKQAVEAYERSLQVYSKADLPQDWARTQANLGKALSALGERNSGEKSTALLEQAIEAYEKALEIYTKADLPQDWVRTQADLGTALSVLGERSSGERAVALLERAEQAYDRALEVLTSVGTREFAEQVLGWAAYIYHEELFDYARAYNSDRLRAQLYPSVINRLGLEEASLSAENFEACLEQARLITDAELEAPQKLARDILRTACQWGLENDAAVAHSTKSLAMEAEQLQVPQWNFSGTKHFLATSPHFEKGRAIWIQIFSSLERGDGAGMAKALGELQQMTN